jgi:hypothetical protein
MKLWIGSIAPRPTDDELTAFVKKYAPHLERTAMQRVEGDGSRPAATLKPSNPPPGALEEVTLRLHGMYWKGRELFCSTILH